MKLLTELIRLGLCHLNLTEADLQSGFKDVEIELRDGSKRTVRLSVVDTLQEPLLRRYADNSDARPLIRPMLSGEFASDAFLDSIAPWSLAMLANTAVGLCLGVEQLRNLVQPGAQLVSPKAGDGSPSHN